MPQIGSLPPIYERPSRLLVVDDDAERSSALSALIRGEGYDVKEISSLDKLLETVTSLSLDLILLHTSIGGGTGLEVCGELRMMEAIRDLPIILLASEAADEETVARGLLAGADDYLATPNRPVELRARIRVQLRNKRYRDALGRVRSEREMFRQAAALDVLTQLPNRRSVEAAIDRKIDGKETFAVLFVDLDHFKGINDRYGHGIGDQVLRGVSRSLSAGMRAGDVCGRWGGEEFIIVLGNIGERTATIVAERHRKAIAAIVFNMSGESKHITASIGIAGFHPDQPIAASELFHRADKAMYEAKRQGRNRVVLDARANLDNDEERAEQDRE